jgi:thioredoxin-related protein
MLLVGIVGGSFVSLALLVFVLTSVIAPPQEDKTVATALSPGGQSDRDKDDTSGGTRERAGSKHAQKKNTKRSTDEDKQNSEDEGNEFKPGGMLADGGLVDSVFDVMEGEEYEVPEGMAGLLVKWPADARAGGKISLNGDSKPMNPSGPLKFDLKPGVYRVALTRPGYKEIVAVVNLLKDKLTQFKTDWKRIELASTGPFRPGDASQYDGWMQDFEAAQVLARQENKDVMIAFYGSDWCGWCIRMAQEVLHQKSFHDRTKNNLVLVFADFPRNPVAKAKVQDAKRNEKLSEKFAVDGYPTIVFTDSDGRPFGVSGYVEGGVTAFMEHISELRSAKKERDELFAKIESSDDEGRFEAAKEALAWLRERDLIGHYAETLNQWYELAEKMDPENEKEQLEGFFEVKWTAGLVSLDREDKDEIQAAVDDFDAWNKEHTIRNADRGARLNLLAAIMLAGIEKEDEAYKYIQAGLQYDSEDYAVVAQLHAASSYLGKERSYGTGFVVAQGGYLLTNHHVIEGPERTVVRFRGEDDKAIDVDADIIAKDKRLDVALLKIDVPAGVDLTPIPINAGAVFPGARVGVFGYPLGDAAGTHLKLTTGIISSLPEKRTMGMLMLDCRVNPGNSGGPLCNNKGECIGLITAKSGGGFGVDSYGMARPGKAVQKYLEDHLPNYAPPDTADEDLEWDKIYQHVSASVLMIVKIDGGKEDGDASDEESASDDADRKGTDKDDTDKKDEDADDDKTEKGRKDEEEEVNPFL